MQAHPRSEALEAQYNLPRRHPERGSMLAAFGRESERVRAALPVQLDVPYGEGPQETLEIFPAAASEPAPVLIFFHGGYWRSMDKRDFSFVAGPLVPAGIAVVAPNYALVPRVSVDEIVEQARLAVAWVCRNAATFGGDPSRIFVSGHSVGGHLAATAALTDWAAAGLPPDLVKGGCSISGLFDLEPLLYTSINDDLRLDAAAAARLSPVRHLRQGLPPFVVAVGALETEEFVRQSLEFAAAWRAAGSPCDEHVLAGLNHYTIILECARPESAVTGILNRLVTG
jgi:arylformamidase